ncbi:DUF1738 domain-containing protein [Porphyrobacter algicida]|uniref:DUF1738 domain-containing protein n=1 Tax=Qipengyuania algicida TaxID=1836209 RepID=A0A845AL07_9SPHN|nr:zincin-like metallopeptidase domain-containing protein [Qipengyuania algicida]MXP30159.1 DUF1738 domain-containing protein [Qipengyuania algicida]
MARGVSKVGAGGKGKRAARCAARGEGSRASLYDDVTATIIEQLEAGVFPWVRPWSKAKASLGLPRNAVTKRPYSGINILVLWGAVIEGGYASQDWLTFRQAQAAGGCVRKGERGRTVFYADRFTPKGDAGGQGSEQAESGEDKCSIPFLKRFTVFNASQCDGLPDGLVSEPAPPPDRELHQAAEDLISATGADYRIGGERAYYSPAADFVMVPPQPAFHHQIDYYRTALHELGHWTGHRSRLDRGQTGGFGSAAYAREELVAELASAFLCAALGIEPTVRHADYLGSWLTVLRADNRAIFKAASQASKAAEHLLQRSASLSVEQAA